MARSPRRVTGLAGSQTMEPLSRRALERVPVLRCGRGCSYNRAYDVSPDDQRFVMVQPVGETADTGELIVVENFFEELREEPE